MKNFLKTIDAQLARGPFLFGTRLTAADFWLGSTYVSIATNDMAYGRAEWAQLLKEFPNFEKFGKNFVS